MLSTDTNMSIGTCNLAVESHYTVISDIIEVYVLHVCNIDAGGIIVAH